MITIDCSNALAIKDQLLVYVADNLKVLPILKSDKFILTPLDETLVINKSDVLSAIMKFLESTNLENNFQIIPKGDNIIIKPFEGKDMKENLEKLAGNKKDLFFECTHCGFMTLYETELKSHKVIHYI